jgi:hypothetical protein
MISAVLLFAAVVLFVLMTRTAPTKADPARPAPAEASRERQTVVRDLAIKQRICDPVLPRTTPGTLASPALTLALRREPIVLTQTVRVAGWSMGDDLLVVLGTPGSALEGVGFVNLATGDTRIVAQRNATPLLPKLTPDRLNVINPDVSTNQIERATTGHARAVLARPGTDAPTYVLEDRVMLDGCDAPLPAPAGEENVNYRAAWSANGQYLAVLRRQSATLPSATSLFIWDTVSGDVREALQDAALTVTGLYWHPGVNTLLLSAAPVATPQDERLWQINPQTGVAGLLSERVLYAPAYWGVTLSPAGDQLALGCPTPDATNGLVSIGAICLFDITQP